MRIGEIELLRVDLSLVGLDGALVLLSKKGLIFSRLTCDRVLLHKRLATYHVGARLIK
jgi:hypothetical protein